MKIGKLQLRGMRKYSLRKTWSYVDQYCNKKIFQFRYLITSHAQTQFVFNLPILIQGDIDVNDDNA